MEKIVLAIIFALLTGCSVNNTPSEEVQSINEIKNEVVNMNSDLESNLNLAPTIKLNNGIEMPVLGIGTYSLHDDTCINSIYTAIQNGYRKIDTAYMYGNEEEVGIAVRKAIADGLIKREDIFVATKLYPNQYDNPKDAIEEALKKLDIEYIDLMLLHHPGDNDDKAYKAMEEYVASGKIKSLGLSNYYIKEIDDFLPNISIKPVLVQNEIHPYYQERDVVKHIQELDIVVEGWYPLGGRGHQTELLNDETLLKIAKNHNKSVAQVILRWDYQNGVIVIPGSSNPEHIKENISIFDFELTEDEMKQIEELNRDEKHDWY
jgi:diketogulonate reductase-like aldo/keto reductase